jgi:hypothetical protein
MRCEVIFECAATWKISETFIMQPISTKQNIVHNRTPTCGLIPDFPHYVSEGEQTFLHMESKTYLTRP